MDLSISCGVTKSPCPHRRSPAGRIQVAEAATNGELATATAKPSPQTNSRTLCAFADRPYTPDELSVLADEHAPKDRPCH